jgi:hypothetical protein
VAHRRLKQWITSPSCLVQAISARYGKYPTKTDREIPIVRLTRISG